MLPLGSIRVLLILPGLEAARFAVDVPAGTALAEVGAPAIESLEVADLLVDPGERFLRRGPSRGKLRRRGPTSRRLYSSGTTSRRVRHNDS